RRANARVSGPLRCRRRRSRRETSDATTGRAGIAGRAAAGFAEVEATALELDPVGLDADELVVGPARPLALIGGQALRFVAGGAEQADFLGGLRVVQREWGTALHAAECPERRTGRERRERPGLAFGAAGAQVEGPAGAFERRQGFAR